MTQSGRNLMILNSVTAVLIAIALGLVFLYAPRELVMGEV
jgi:hypothetical protein